MADKLPSGVTIKNSKLVIRFTFRGKRYVEIYGPNTPTNMIQAAGKVQRIKENIKLGTFDYAMEFPNSPNRNVSMKGEKVNYKMSLQHAYDVFFDDWKSDKQKSTIKEKKEQFKKIGDFFGERRQCRDITKQDVVEFKEALIDPDQFNLQLKGANKVLNCLRNDVLREAYLEGAIDANPAERVKNYRFKSKSGGNCDPFTAADIEAMENCEYFRPQDKHLALFGIYTGLSVSELRALCWEDIDFNNNVINVQRAEVAGQLKCPKETVRERQVEMVGPAKKWLFKQMPFTINLPAREVEVIQEGAKEIKKEKVTFIFLNDQFEQKKRSAVTWSQATQERRFKQFLEACGVRLRGPNQTRHTFASRALSAYVPIEWIQHQLGHSTLEMIRKHYGQFIKNETRKMVNLVEELMSMEDFQIPQDALTKPQLEVVK